MAALVARSYLPEEASRDPQAIKAAVEGVIADVVFELQTERSTRNQRGAAVSRPGTHGFPSSIAERWNKKPICPIHGLSFRPAAAVKPRPDCPTPRPFISLF